MSDTRGQLKYPLVQGSKPKVVLAVVIALVSIQTVLFAWTVLELSKTKTAIARAEKLLTQLSLYSGKTLQKKPVSTVTKAPAAVIQKKTTSSGISYSFDTPDSQPKIGKELLLVKKNPNDTTEKISVQVDEKSRLGSVGNGLKIEYQFNNPPVAGDWVGVEFVTPTKGSELTFWIRGDAKAGFSKKIKLLVLDGGQKRTLNLPITSIGTFWKRIQFPLNGNVETVRLVIESDGVASKGAYNLDKFEIR